MCRAHVPLCLSTHDRPENLRLIQQRVTDELIDISPEYEQIPIEFHLTSIYDHSLHEAFSRVLHKLIPPLPYLEDLLNVFCAVRCDRRIRIARAPADDPLRSRRRPRRSCLTFRRGCMSRRMRRLLTPRHTVSVVIIYKC